MNTFARIPTNPEAAEIDRMQEEAWLQLREECEAEFEDWQRADYDAREFEDFSNWLVNKARWNRPNKYEGALDWSERRRVDLVKLSAGQRQFVRGGL
jgi:hypothetical protein